MSNSRSLLARASKTRVRSWSRGLILLCVAMIQVSLEAGAFPPGFRCAKGEIWQIKIGGDCARGVCMELLDRKSTRLNSSHTVISYAVFCLKKKRNFLHHDCHRSAHRKPAGHRLL